MLLVDGDPTQGIDVLKDYERNFVVIIKDGKILGSGIQVVLASRRSFRHAEKSQLLCALLEIEHYQDSTTFLRIAAAGGPDPRIDNLLQRGFWNRIRLEPSQRAGRIENLKNAGFCYCRFSFCATGYFRA
jgi:hypothetical protein